MYDILPTIGNMMGFEEDRGQMFFRIMDIVNIKKPKYLLLENVKNLLAHDGGRTYSKIIEEIDKAGYYQQTLLLNTADYGLPQKRYRVLIFARRKHFGKFSFCEEEIKSHFECIDKSNCSLLIYNNVLDILNKKVESKYYLSERVKPTILSDGTGGYKSHSEIDQIIARTLTATMNKMHRACQDNYYSDEFLQSGGKNRPSERMNKEELAKIPIRKLTPEEAFMLQGFPADFVKKAREKEVSDGALYTQSGNAVSVNTIYTLLHFLINKGIIKKPLNKRSKM
jgi:DNA (cytosine-5)-methyltransferase 1